jgi:hypothetical protein
LREKDAVLQHRGVELRALERIRAEQALEIEADKETAGDRPA